MDAQRLLGMLNGGSSQPAAPQRQSSSTASPGSNLNDMFNALGMASPSSNQGSSLPPSQAPPSGSGNATELFRGAGMLPNIPPPPSHHHGGISGPNRARVVSPGAGNAQSLLATLMSGNLGSSSPSPAPDMPFGLGQPVIGHNSPQSHLASQIPLPMSPAPPLENRASSFSAGSNQQPQPLTKAPERSLSTTEQPTTLSSTEKEATPREEQLASPQVDVTATKESAPTASKFHFVSPFDAFDLPAPAAPVKPKAKKDGPTSPAVRSPTASKPSTPKVAKQTPAGQIPTPAKGNSPQPAPSVPKPPTEPKKVSEKPVAQAEMDAVSPISYPLQGKPGSPAAHPLNKPDYVFDLSKDHLDSCRAVNDEDLEKIASVKCNVIAGGMSKGKMVSTTNSYIAYALTKGKIRIIHYQSGANTAIVLADASGQAAKISEIAISENWIAAIGVDGRLGLWLLVYRPDQEELTAVSRWLSPPSTDPSRIAKSIHWIGNEGRKRWLLLTTVDAVYQLPPESLAKHQADGVKDWSVIGLRATSDDQEQNILAVSSEPLSDRYVVLRSDNRLEVGISGQATLRSVKVDGPAHGGVWQSTIWTSSKSIILASDKGEYTIRFFDGRSSDATTSTLYLHDPSSKEHASSCPVTTSAYDDHSHILWIAVWARSTILAVKVLPTYGCKLLSFTEMALGPISHLAVEPGSMRHGSRPAVIYRHPTGFTAVAPSSSTLAKLQAAADTVHDPNSVVLRSNPPEQGTHPAEAQESQLREVEPLLAPEKVKEEASISTITAPVPESIPAGPELLQAPELSPAPDFSSEMRAAAEIDYAKIQSLIASAVSTALKEEISKLASQQGDMQVDLKAAFANQEAKMQSSLSQAISYAVQTEMGATLSKAVQQEMTSSVLPSLHQVLKDEVEAHVGEKLATAILFSVETTVMSQVEKALVPHLGRTFTSILSPAVDKSVRSLIDEKLLPQFIAAVEHIPVEVSRAIHQEMLEVRKDVMIEQSSQATTSDAVMSSMTKSLATLTEQVQALTREVQSLRSTIQAPPNPPGYNGSAVPAPMPQMMPPTSGSNTIPPAFNGSNNMPPQAMASAQHQIISPQPVLAPNVGALQQLVSPSEDAEDIFLKAFSSLSEGELTQFVMSRMPRTAEYLPDPRERPSPLSQAVLLTMIHRLSKCLAGYSPESREFQAVMTWVFRASVMIDPNDESIQDYLPAVRKTLEDTFRNAMDQFARIGDRSPASRSAGQMMHKIITILGRPLV